MDLHQCSAVVSGGAGGLGGATSRRLVELGAGVVVFETEAAKAEALADELGNRAVAVQGDHNDDGDVARAIDAARELGVFSINVNAAGVIIQTPATATADGTPHDMQTFRQMFELHVFGPFNMSRLCAAAFATNEPDDDGERGVIVNTSSVAAYDGQARQVAYSAAKAGITAMALSMARDLAPIGVRVCAIAPAPMWTPRLSGAPEEIQQKYLRNIAFPKRFGKGEEFASLVEMILRTPFLNGQTIRLDGAMSTPLD